MGEDAWIGPSRPGRAVWRPTAGPARWPWCASRGYSDALLDAALGLDDTLADLAPGLPGHSVCQTLAGQVRVAEAAANTLREDIASGQAQMAADVGRIPVGGQRGAP